MRDFRKYEVWQSAHALTLDIYLISNGFPANEQYGITSQLRRAAVSIPTNISEGCGRSSDADFARFIHIALGSAHEVEYLIQLCYDLKYIEESTYKDIDSKVNLIKRKLYHLEKKINSKN